MPRYNNRRQCRLRNCDDGQLFDDVNDWNFVNSAFIATPTFRSFASKIPVRSALRWTLFLSFDGGKKSTSDRREREQYRADETRARNNTEIGLSWFTEDESYIFDKRPTVPAYTRAIY